MIEGAKYDIRQDIAEIDWLIDLFKARGVTSFLEIGSRFGGSLWRIATALPKDSFIVSVDRPADEAGKQSLLKCAADIVASGRTVKVFLGDSHDPSIIERVESLGPFDAAFIDGDHTLDGVNADWVNYGKMAKLVAFHDISAPARKDGHKVKGIFVPQLWETIKAKHQTYEKISDTGYKRGIGVVWGHI